MLNEVPEIDVPVAVVVVAAVDQEVGAKIAGIIDEFLSRHVMRCDVVTTKSYKYRNILL